MNKALGHSVALALAGAVSLAAPALTARAGGTAIASRAADTSATASAARLDPAALQQAIEIQPGDHAGGVIASARDGGQRWWGQVPDTVTGRPIPPDAHIRLGSITKTFVAAMALQLAADRVVDLDHTIQSYLPGLLPGRYQPITIRELLNMTSGLPQIGEGAPAGTASQAIADRFGYQTLGQIIEGTVRPSGRPWPGPHFAPGTKQQYDSLNYRIVAELIEKRTGHSFASELSARILRPLHLTQTFPAAGSRPMPDPYLHGYVADDEGTLVDVSEQAGDDTSMISAPRDIDRFFTALFSGRLLPSPGLRQMVTVPDVPYADSSDCLIGPERGRACYGLGIQRLELGDGTTLWGKTGSDLGYFSAYFRTLTGHGRTPLTLFYSLAETKVNGDGTPVGLRLAKAMGLPLS